jgi:hypothetical protein
MPWRVKVYLTKDKDDWLYVVDEITLEPMVFDTLARCSTQRSPLDNSRDRRIQWT